MRRGGPVKDGSVLRDEAGRMDVHHIVVEAMQLGGNDVVEAVVEKRDLADIVDEIPLLYYSYHDIVSSKLHGFDDNVMDIHPSRFVSKD